MPAKKGYRGRKPNTKRFEKNVQEIVRKQLTQEIEEKHCIVDYVRTVNPAITSGNVTSNPNFFQLMPEISQSVSGSAGKAYNTRIGNEINLKELEVNGFINYASERALDNTNAKLAVRIMILRAKEINDQETLFQDMPTDSLIRFGNFASGTPNGAAAYQGFTLDSFRDINRDAFSVRYDKVINLNADRVLSGTTSVTTTYTPSGVRLFSHKLKFGKNGLKLKYSSQADEQANNMPYFMVVGYSSMTENTVPALALVDVNCSVVGTYTDA